MKNRDSKIQTIVSGYRRGFLSRREALRALGAAGLVAGAAPLLDFAALADEAGKQPGPGGIPLSRPNMPVTLPLNGTPIKSGLEPEKGPFHIYTYQDYVDPVAVVETFSKKYGVEVVITTFDEMDQAITRLATGTVDVDCFNITPERTAQAVAGKLLQPINHSYIPNLAKNVFKSFQNPFYDQGSQYTVPYNVYSTGIGWRTDKVSEDIGAMANPWSIFWDESSKKYSGYTGILADTREALGMAMMYRGFPDLNTEDPAELEKALADLKATIPVTNPKINITQYQTLADGTSWIHQAWSGDLLGAVVSYWPEGQDKSIIKYWWPGKEKGVTQNDCWCVMAKAKNPVLAHLWMNHLLDADVGYANSSGYTGYQPALATFNAEQLVKDEILPEQLKNIILTEDDLGAGSNQYCALTANGMKIWQDAYAKFSSGS
jgi:spermidine/putrescine transport system substrate-binding protein